MSIKQATIRIQRNGGVVYRFDRNDFNGISGCCTSLGFSFEEAEAVAEWAESAKAGDTYVPKDSATNIICEEWVNES